MLIICVSVFLVFCYLSRISKYACITYVKYLLYYWHFFHFASFAYILAYCLLGILVELKVKWKELTPRAAHPEQDYVHFPVGRIHRLLRKGNHAERSLVYLPAVPEYLSAESAGNAARDNKKS